MQKMNFVLKSKERNCEVFSGYDIEYELINYVKNFKSDKFVIITDSRVEKLHAKNFYKKLIKENVNAFIVSFKEGEKNKTRKTKNMLEDFMFEKKCGRDTCIIAFGGGVVGDLAGFVAGTYMRGIPVIQVPTTTISIADSSYGGKTAIDVPAGKNLIGVYHQPLAVFMDAKYLLTLDERNYVSGLIEFIKHGWIKDKKFYEFIKNNLNIILNKKSNEYGKVMEKFMSNNIVIKRDIVVYDETESNLRKILNYGHTIGHAIEKLSNFKLLHGEAIAIGICVESFLAYKKNICSKETFIEQKNFINSIGLSTKIPDKIKTSDIVELMRLDKKARNSTPEITLISKIGKYAIFENKNVAKRFEIEELKKIINEYRKL